MFARARRLPHKQIIPRHTQPPSRFHCRNTANNQTTQKQQNTQKTRTKKFTITFSRAFSYRFEDQKRHLLCQIVTSFFSPTPSWLSPGRYTRSTAAKRWIVNIMQGRLSVDSLKSAGNGPITVQWAIPSNTKQTIKGKQTNKIHQNTTTPKNKQDTEKWDRYQLWEMRCTMTSCVIMSMARKRSKTKTTRKNTRGHTRGWKKQQSSMRKPGISPARIPEITESSHSGITFTQALRSKQRRRRVATRVVRNEKRWDRRWDVI